MNREHLVITLPVCIVIFMIVFCVWAFVPGRITEGYVVDKIYEPEHTQLISTGKTMITQIIKEAWYLRIEGHSPARGLRKEGVRRQKKKVLEEVYKRYKIGDWIKFK